MDTGETYQPSLTDTYPHAAKKFPELFEVANGGKHPLLERLFFWTNHYVADWEASNARLNGRGKAMPEWTRDILFEKSLTQVAYGMREGSYHGPRVYTDDQICDLLDVLTGKTGPKNYADDLRRWYERMKDSFLDRNDRGVKRILDILDRSYQAFLETMPADANFR